MRIPALFPVLAALLVACAPAPVRPPRDAVKGAAEGRHGVVPEGTPPEVDIARSRARGGEQRFAWAPWGEESFARAKREGRFILLDGAASWCHWCHVMDETTYLDPEVNRLLQERFVAIRFDVDEHPDLAERYGDWGWPATIVLTPDARELGKYRGYLPPEELRTILGEIDQARAALERAEAAVAGPRPAEKPGPPEALGWIAARVGLDMDRYYDDEEGGWGRQKVPLGWNVLFELRRAEHGDGEARARAVLTLGKHRALLDPVWGGVYQYSVGGRWDDPHFEKLMPLQASNLEAFARTYALTKDPAMLASARAIAGYLDRFLSNAEGAFLVSQDADVGGHDRRERFVDGHVYYRLDEKARLALGTPRVDDSVYGHENGLAIAALCALHEVTKDAGPLTRARRAADLLLRTHVEADGAVQRPRRDGVVRKARYLADHAALGLGLARLAEVTGEASYREAAVRIAAAMDRDLTDAASGAWLASTPDPAAAGVFARQERPVTPNALALRLEAALHRLTGDEAYRARGRRALTGLATPAALASQGRMVGEVLLAMDELGVYPW